MAAISAAMVAAECGSMPCADIQWKRGEYWRSMFDCKTAHDGMAYVIQNSGCRIANFVSTASLSTSASYCKIGIFLKSNLMKCLSNLCCKNILFEAGSG